MTAARRTGAGNAAFQRRGPAVIGQIPGGVERRLRDTEQSIYHRPSSYAAHAGGGTPGLCKLALSRVTSRRRFAAMAMQPLAPTQWRPSSTTPAPADHACVE